MTSSYPRLPSHLPSSTKFLSHFPTFWLFLFLCCDPTGFSHGCWRGHGFEAVHRIMIMSTEPPLTGGHMAKDNDYLSPSVHRRLLAPLRGGGPMRPAPSMNVYGLCLVQAYADNPSCCWFTFPPSESLSLPSFLPSGSHPLPILFSTMFFEPWKGAVCV